MSEPSRDSDGRRTPRGVLLHAIVGGLAGFVAGAITGAFTLLWEASSFPPPMWAGSLVSIAILGIPAGAILGVSLRLVDYRSKPGVEWALVGPAGALLFVASLGQLRARPLAIALTLFGLSGWLAPRAVGWALGTVPRRADPTAMTLAGLAATTVALASAYWAVFEVILANVD